MEHSLQAYIKKQSSEELLAFLQMCMYRNQWAQYADSILHIFAELQSRNFPIPEQISACFADFLQNIQADSVD